MRMAARHQFIRFLAGGLFNTVITYVLFIGLAFFLSNAIAYTISYAVGIAISYLINTCFVFSTRVSVRSALNYPSVYLVQYLLGLAALRILTEFGLPGWAAMIGVLAVNVPITFFLTRLVLTHAKTRNT